MKFILIFLLNIESIQNNFWFYFNFIWYGTLKQKLLNNFLLHFDVVVTIFIKYHNFN